jgi:hypothetical protein
VGGGPLSILHYFRIKFIRNTLFKRWVKQMNGPNYLFVFLKKKISKMEVFFGRVPPDGLGTGQYFGSFLLFLFAKFNDR